MPSNNIDQLVSAAAVQQIDKLKVQLNDVVNSIAEINKRGAELEAQLTKGNLGWAKTIGKMKEVAANGVELEASYKRLVTANDALQAAENKHNARLKQLAEAQRMQNLLNEELVITNNKVTNSTLQVNSALSAKAKADLKAQQAAMAGLAQNTRAQLSSAANVAQTEREIVSIEMLTQENKRLIAQRATLDITTSAGRASIQALNVGIAENTRLIAANTAANAANVTTVASVGKGLTRALGYLRTMAYILPGIGIAGIFNILIEGVTKLVTGFSDAAGAQKRLNEAMKEAQKSYDTEIWNLDRLYKKSQDTTLSTEERTEAVRKLQKLFPAYFADIKDETMLNGGAAESYNTLRASIMAVAKAKAIENAATKIFNDDLDKETKLLAERDKALKNYADNYGKAMMVRYTPLPFGGHSEYKEGGYGVAQAALNSKEANEVRRVAVEKAQKELDDFKALQKQKLDLLELMLDKQEKLIDDKVKKAKEKAAKKEPRGQADMTDNSATAYLDAEKAKFMANYELMKKDSEKQADINKKIVDSETEIMKERHGLLEEYDIYKANLLVTDEQRGKDEIAAAEKITQTNADELFEKQKALAAYYAYKQNLITLEQTKELKEIEFQNIAIENKMAQLQTKLASGKLSGTNTATVKREIASQQFLHTENLKTIGAINTKFDGELLDSKKQHAIDAQNLNLKYDKKAQQATINRWTWIKNFNARAAAEELAMIQGNLDAWSTMLEDGVRESTDLEIYQFKKKMEKLNTYLDLVETSSTIINGIADAMYAHEMGLIDAREKKLNEKYDEDKKRITSSFTNKVDQERELMKLEAVKEAQQKKIDKDRRAAARKQARDQKMGDVASIIGSTYVAVMGALGAKPWTFANIALAAGVAATGAANLARVIATPLPAYKHGVGDHPGGLAVVGDGGKRELVKEPGKAPWITANVPTVVDLPKHTMVMPDASLAMPLYTAGIINMAANNKNTTEGMATAMVEAFENKIDELIAETKNGKSNTFIDIINLSSHDTHVRKNIR